MASKVFWTKQEKAILSKDAATLVAEEGISVIKAINLAQAKLPPHRRRTILQTKHARDLVEQIFDLVLKHESKPAIKAEPEVSPRSPIGMMLEDLVRQIVREEFSKLLKEEADKLSAAEAAPPAETGNFQRETIRIRKPKILVVGLLPRQQRFVEQQFAGKCQFRFHKNQSMKLLQEMTRGADDVFLMTKFISHQHQFAVQSERRDYHLVAGGLTDLVDKIAVSYQ